MQTDKDWYCFCKQLQRSLQNHLQ